MNRPYVVADRTQVNHDGRTFGPGAVVNLSAEEAAPLVAAGTVSPAADKDKATKKR